jgi:hypothetical protein
MAARSSVRTRVASSDWWPSRNVRSVISRRMAARIPSRVAYDLRA